jgi:peptide/nickel transport system permease protein
MTDQAIGQHDLNRLPPKPSIVKRWARGIGLIRESKMAMIGAGIVIFWILVALLAPILAPFPYTQQVPDMEMTAPFTAIPDGYEITEFTAEGMQRTEVTGTYIFGGDQLGRDVLSRIIYGAQPVLIWAPLATFCAYAVGIVLGLLAGYKRGWIDNVLSRVSDMILSFPVIVLYVVLITALGGRSTFNIVLAVTFASAPGIMRIVRGLTLDLATRDYVSAAQTRGESMWYIMFVEILPNARGPLIVDACLRLGYTIIILGALGFLGLGLPPPDPNWGNLIAENRTIAMTAPNAVIFPVLAISTLVLGFNMMADGLREISLRD